MASFETIDTLQKAVLSCRGKFNGTALIFENKTISYHEFDCISDHIAEYLLSRGLGSGTVVALSMMRSEKMIAAIYGIFKAGACLLPIPVNLPKKRKEMIFKDIEIAMEFTDDWYEKTLKESVSDRPEYTLAAPDDDALILYTSGSTGNPKGVCHSQASMLLSLDQFPLHVMKTGISVKRTDTIIAKTNINFISAYMFEILVAPLSGRVLHVLGDNDQNSPKAVGKAISGHNDTCVFITPSQILSFLKDKGFAEAFRGLGTLITAGELLKPEARMIILEHADDRTSIIDIYGSSECHLISAADVRLDAYPDTALLKGVEACIIDEDGELCAPGVKGELAILSPCMFSRYTNACKRTAVIDGKEYFLTGDLGVISDTRRIKIKGRKDRMIKYHGLRIELSDIENNILRYPGINECAVVANMTEGGSQVLCAYFVSDNVTDTAGLREFLSEYLPQNIIPAGFIRLDTLPVNPNGKTDYYQLSSMVFVPEAVDISSYSDVLSTDNEKILASVISEIWENAVLSPASNLFALGLDSLIAIRLQGKLNERGYELGIAQIFSHPVLRELAALIKPCKTDLQEDYGDDRVLTATGVQIYWGYDITPQKKAHGMYVTSNFVCERNYTEDSFKNRVDEIVKRHPALSTRIVFDNGIPGQLISDDPVILTRYDDISELNKSGKSDFEPDSLQNEHIRTVSESFLESIINKEEVISFAAYCFRISKKACYIMCIGNHLSVDGSSMNILMEELSSESIEKGQDSYTDFLKYIGKKSSIDKAMDFWKDYLKDADFSGLPSINENPETMHEPSEDFKTITIPLTVDETERLQKKCSEMGVSTVGFIMYLYGKSLMKVLKKNALIFQMLTFGRGVPVSGVDRSVGCFIEYVPIVIRKDESPVHFQAGYLMAEEYSYLPTPILWKTALGLDEAPELAPFLISEIFPPVRTKGYFKEITNRDYAHMLMSNFIVMEDGHITIYFHYDADKTASEPFVQMTDELFSILKKECL